MSQLPARAVVRDVLATSFLADVPVRAAESLLRDAVLHSVRPGDVFMVQGDAHRCGIVIGGLVRAFISLPDGRERTIREVEPGGAVGVAALAGLPNPISVQAIVASFILDLDPDRLIAVAEDDARVAMAIAREVTGRSHDTYALLAAERGPARQRLARRLLDMAAEARTPTAMPRITHDELAAQLGCSREWITKTLSHFRREGLVSVDHARVIRVADPIRLHLVANDWCALEGGSTSTANAAEG